MLLPIGAATYLITKFAVARLGNIPPNVLALAQLQVVEELRPFCEPESAEQLAFVVSIALAPCLMLLATLLLKRLRATVPLASGHPWLGLFALGGQILAFGAMLVAIDFESTRGYQFRFFGFRATISLALIGALLLAARSLSRETRVLMRQAGARRFRSDVLPWILATLWIINYLSTTVFLDKELPFLTTGVGAHLPYTMGEFAAVLNGRTPLVNFNPQYQNLYALILYPWFKLVGFSVSTYTAAMATLSLIGLLCLYSAMTRVFRSAWAALVLLLPMMAFGFYSEESNPGAYITNVANYYAAVPIRYLALFVLARLSVFYLEKPNAVRLLVVSSSAALFAMNNLDFGIPSGVGVLACVILYPPTARSWGLLRRMVAAGGIFVTTGLATLGICLGIMRLAVGAWPSLSTMTQYQNAFALVGFFMVALPEKGLYWVIYGTIVAAMLVPVYETFGVRHETITANRRVVNGSLAFSGIAMLGAFAYYIGRSLPEAFGMVLFAWSYLVAQFAHRAWVDWTTARGSTSNHWLAPLPGAAIAAVLAMAASSLVDTPNMVQQVHRLRTLAKPDDSGDKPLIALIQKYVPPGKRTVIAYRDAHWLALRARVVNVSPFTNVGSLILLKQLDAVMAALYRLPAHDSYLFGSPPLELRQRLLDNGYRQLETIGDFSVWARKSRENG